MYRVNGIDLQSSEFNELRLLVEAEKRGEDIGSVATRRLQPDGNMFDDRICEIYLGLHDAGLVSGFSVHSGFIFSSLTQKGIDFFEDYETSVSEEKSRIEAQRKHDYKVAAYGAIAGGLLGLFSGALASWLLDWLAYFFSR